MYNLKKTQSQHTPQLCRCRTLYDFGKYQPSGSILIRFIQISPVIHIPTTVHHHILIIAEVCTAYQSTSIVLTATTDIICNISQIIVYEGALGAKEPY